MFSIERSGYYAWLKHKPGKRKQANEVLDKKLFTFLNHIIVDMAHPVLPKSCMEMEKFAVKIVLHAG